MIEPQDRTAWASDPRPQPDTTERTTLERGLREMQLELMVPRDWAHPHKEFLTAWYGRCGYRLVRIGSVREAYPHLIPHLATVCDLQIHRKLLVSALGRG